MAKFPPIPRSTLLMILNLIIGILGGNALPPLPFIGADESLCSAPATPLLPAPILAPAPPSGIGGNSGIEPAIGAAPPPP